MPLHASLGEISCCISTCLYCRCSALLLCKWNILCLHPLWSESAMCFRHNTAKGATSATSGRILALQDQSPSACGGVVGCASFITICTRSPYHLGGGGSCQRLKAQVYSCYARSFSSNLSLRELQTHLKMHATPALPRLHFLCFWQPHASRKRM